MKPASRLRVIVRIGSHTSHAFEAGIVSYARKQRWIVRFQGPDGRVAARATEDADGMIATVPRRPRGSSRRAAIPIVVFAPTAGSSSGHRVVHDGIAVGRLGAEHFLSRGYRHFAFYSRGRKGILGERLRGFREALAAAGWTAEWLRGGPGELRSRLAEMPRPLALMAGNDRHALAVLDACQILDLDVPYEIAVLGVDDDQFAGELAPVPLSSIDDNLHRKGVECARMLDRLMRGDADVPELVRVPPAGVVARRSTDSVAVDHPVLARALFRMRELAFGPGLSMAEILAGVPMSRRGVYALFRRELGVSPWEHVIRLRLERARKLLAGDELRIGEIATRCGFAGTSHLYQAFRKRTGMSPRQWRKTQQGVPPGGPAGRAGEGVAGDGD
jgi:LacI family transcriptional regulator